MIQSQYSASGNPLMAGPGMEGLRTEPSLSSCDPCGADGDPWADGCCPGCVPHYTYDGVLMNNATFRAEITNQTRVQDFPAFQTIKPLSNWVYRYFFAHHDFHRVSGYPWPGLRKLDWPDPHAMLPPGVGKELLASFTQIRSEVQAAVAADATLLTAEGDAYPSIAG